MNNLKKSFCLIFAKFFSTKMSDFQIGILPQNCKIFASVSMQIATRKRIKFPFGSKTSFTLRLIASSRTLHKTVPKRSSPQNCKIYASVSMRIATRKRIEFPFGG